MPPVSKQLYSKMKTLIVLFCAAAAQGAVYLPHAYHAAAAYPVHGVAKSTITYKTAAWEPVDAATPAATQKIELKETEHEQEIPTLTYAHAPVVNYGLPAVHAALPAVHALPATYAALPAIHHAALPAIHHALPAAAPAISYSLGGVPFVIPAVAAAPAAEAAEEPAVEEA